MNIHKTLLGAVAAVGIMAGASAANAAFVTVSWDLTGINDNNMCDLSSSSGDAGTIANPVTFDGVDGDACSGGNPDNSYDASAINQGEFDFHRGNVLTFESTSSSDGLTKILQAAAFSVVSPTGSGSDDDLQTAVLANYSPGLGAIDSEEVDEGSPEHTVDNNDFTDFVVFRFASDEYDPLSTALSLFNDGDIEVFIGGTDAEFGGGNGFAGFVGYDIDDFYADTATWTHLNRQCDFDTETGDDCGSPKTYVLDAGDTNTAGSSADNLSIFGGDNDATGLGGALGRYMVIAARDTTSPFKDKFKIKTLAGGVDETTQTPEPMTIALLGVGLVGLGAASRRRKAA